MTMQRIVKHIVNDIVWSIDLDEISSRKPNPVEADMWFDESSNWIKLWDGVEWAKWWWDPECPTGRGRATVGG